MGRGWISRAAGGSYAARFGAFLGLLLTAGLLAMHGVGAQQEAAEGESHGRHVVTQFAASDLVAPSPSAPTVTALAAAPVGGASPESCADCGMSDHLTMAMACALALLCVVVAFLLRRGPRATPDRRTILRQLLSMRSRLRQRPSLISLCISRT